MRFALPVTASCAAAAMVTTLGLTVPAQAAGSAAVTPDIEEQDLTSVSEDGLDAPGARSSSTATASATNESTTTNLPDVMRSEQALTALGASLEKPADGAQALPISLAENPEGSDGSGDSESSAPSESPEASEEETAPEPSESSDISGGVKEKTEDGMNIAAISDILDVPNDYSSVVGVTFESSSPVVIEVRTNTESGWTDWVEIDEENQDEGTAGTEPYIVNSSSEVQFRILGDEAPSGTKLMVVDPKRTDADAQAVAQNAPVVPDAGAPAVSDEQESAVEDGGLIDLPDAANANAAGASYTPGSADVQNTAVKKVSKPKITSRKSWGANESLRNGSADYASSVKAAVVHHTAGSNSYSADDVPGILRGILSFHTQGRGWSDIGYNVLADKYGRLWEGRAGGLDRTVIGAHAMGYNTGTFGISVMGTYENSAPPQKTIDAVNHAIAWKLSKDGVSAKDTTTVGGTRIKTVSAHRDVGQTSCSGAAFYKKMGGMRTAISKMQSSGDSDSGKEDSKPKKTPIEKKYEGHAKELGKKINGEWSHAGGKVQTYEKGYITYSKKTGARVLTGEIGKLYKSKAVRAQLGLATKDQKSDLKNGGKFQKFQKGSVHLSKDTPAVVTSGVLQEYWGSKGYENGHLGYPVKAADCSDDRCEQLFEGARLVWADGYGVTEFSPKGSIEGGARDLNIPQSGSEDDESSEPGSGPAGSGEDPADAGDEEPTPTETDDAGAGEGSADSDGTESSPEPTQTASPTPTKTSSPKPTKTASPEPKPTKTSSPKPTKTASPKPTPTKTEKPKEKTDAEKEKEKRDAIIATAKKHLGVKYRWGGTSPSTGWDCSGYTQYVYKQNGIDLPRTTSAQRGAGKVIKASEAKPGDLVWVPGHIGIISESKGMMYDAGSSRTNTSKRSYSWMLDRGAVFIRVV